MKKSIKVLSILMMVALITMTAIAPVFASGSPVDVESIKGQITYGDSSSMQELAGKILGFIRNIAIVGGVVIIAVLGVKYMMGSLEEKAEYKKSMIPLIVGIVVVMSATTIAKLLFDTFTL